MSVCLPSTYTHDLQHSILPLDNILFEKDDGTFKVPAKIIHVPKMNSMAFVIFNISYDLQIKGCRKC